MSANHMVEHSMKPLRRPVPKTSGEVEAKLR